MSILSCPLEFHTVDGRMSSRLTGVGFLFLMSNAIEPAEKACLTFSVHLQCFLDIITRKVLTVVTLEEWLTAYSPSWESDDSELDPDQDSQARFLAI